MSNHRRTTDDDHQDEATADTVAPTSDTSAPETIIDQHERDDDVDTHVDSTVDDEDWEDVDEDQSIDFDEVIIANGVNLIYSDPWDIELQTYYPIDDGTDEGGAGVAAMPLTVPELQAVVDLGLAALEDFGALESTDENDDDLDDDDLDDDEDSGRIRRAMKGSARAAKTSGGAVKKQWDTVARNPQLEWTVFADLLNKRWRGLPVGWILLAICIAIGIYGFVVV